MKALAALTAAHYFFLFIAGAAAVTFSMNFTRKQRREHAWVRLKDGRQISLAIICITSMGAAYAFAAARDYIETAKSFAPLTTGDLVSTDHATITAFSMEARDAASQVARRASDYFALGEEHLSRRSFQNAERSFTSSVRILPTASGWLNLGIAQRYQAKYVTAERSLNEALKLSQTQELPRFDARASTQLGLTRGLLGQAEGCETAIARAVALFAQLGDDRGLAGAYQNLGVCRMFAGDAAAAREQFNHVLELSESLDDSLLKGLALSGRGLLDMDRGNVHSALHDHEASLKIMRQKRDAWGEAMQLGHVGGVLVYLGQLERAESLLSQGAALANRVGASELEIIALVNLSSIATFRSDYVIARTRAERALTKAQETRGPRLIAFALNRRADALRGQGEFGRAESDLKHALELFHENYALGRVDSLLGLAELYRDTKHWREADKWAIMAYELAEKNEIKFGIACAAGIQGENAHGRGDTRLACGKWQEALTGHREIETEASHYGVIVSRYLELFCTKDSGTSLLQPPRGTRPSSNSSSATVR